MRNKSVSTINGSTAFSSSFSVAHTVSALFMGFFSLTLFLTFSCQRHTRTHKIVHENWFYGFRTGNWRFRGALYALCDAKLFRFPSELMKNASLFSGKNKQFQYYIRHLLPFSVDFFSIHLTTTYCLAYRSDINNEVILCTHTSTKYQHSHSYTLTHSAYANTNTHARTHGQCTRAYKAHMLSAHLHTRRPTANAHMHATHVEPRYIDVALIWRRGDIYSSRSRSKRCYD